MADGYRFLVLDDDPDLRFLNRRALERAFAGCEVVEAHDCADALACVAAGPLDAVVADHQLRGASGAECITLMRERGLTCPVLLVTSSEDPRVHEGAYAAGADYVFSPGNADFVGYLRSTLPPR